MSLWAEKTIVDITSQKQLDTLTAVGMHRADVGLWLQIRSPRARSWIFRYERDGRVQIMGLGSAALVPLVEAKAKAIHCRRQLLEGIDPKQAREAERTKARTAALRSKSFEFCAGVYIEGNKSAWRSVKHARQWEATLRTYAYPIIGTTAVSEIAVTDIERVLSPIWVEKPETANRLRGRIETILDWATSKGFREGDNPALLRGPLRHLLTGRGKGRRVKHHASLGYREVPRFMTELRATDGTAACLLEFTILTATRTGEAIGACWDEFDLEAAEWNIPGARMKAGRSFKVALSPAAAAVIESMRPFRQDDFVFPSMRSGRPLSNMAMLATLKRMERNDVTVHGFRSSFRTWAWETTDYPREVAEFCLAHTVASAVEASYARTTLLEKRRALMNDWAAFCARSSNVIELGTA